MHKAEIHATSCIYLRSIRVKLIVWWDCKVGKHKYGKKHLLSVTGIMCGDSSATTDNAR